MEIQMTRTPYMPLYFSWSHILSDLSDAEYGKLLKAVVAYAEGNTETPELPRHLALAYRFIIDTIDRSGRKMAKAAETEPETAKEPAKPEENQNTAPTNKAENEEIQDASATLEPETADNQHVSPTFEVEAIQNHPSSATSDVKSDTNQHHSPTSQKFTPPPLEAVAEHFKTQGYASNPEEFYNFYSSNGWLVGQNPMRNWQASASNWEIKNHRERTATNPPVEKPRAGTFDVHEAFKKALERSYGGFYDDDDEEEE